MPPVINLAMAIWVRCVCVCVCGVCVCVCVCPRVSRLLHRLYMYVRVYKRYIQTYLHTYIHTHIHRDIHTDRQTDRQTDIRRVHVHTHNINLYNTHCIRMYAPAISFYFYLVSVGLSSCFPVQGLQDNIRTHTQTHICTYIDGVQKKKSYTRVY